MAKLKVLKTFRDKVDHKTWYKTGQEINIADAERSEDLVTRGLCVEVKGKTSGKNTKKSGTEQQPTGGADGQDAHEAGSEAQPNE